MGYYQSEGLEWELEEGVRFKVVFDELIRKGLIYCITEEPSGYSVKTKLTTEGEKFVSFSLQREKEAKEKELVERKEKADIGMKEFIYKYRYLPYITALISLILFIFSVFIAFNEEKMRAFPKSLYQLTR